MARMLLFADGHFLETKACSEPWHREYWVERPFILSSDHRNFDYALHCHVLLI